MIGNLFGLKKQIFWLLAGMIVGSVGLWLTREVEPTVAILGLAIIWVALLPGLLYLQGIDRSPIPFFPLVGVFYTVFFGLPVFLVSLVPMRNSKIILYNKITIENIDPKVLMIVLGGIVAMEAAYFGIKWWPLNKMPRFRLDTANNPNTLNILYWLLALIHFAYELAPVIGSITSLGQIAGPVIYLALGGLFLQWRADRLPQFQIILLFAVAIPLTIFIQFSGFLITPLLLLLLFAVLVCWREHLKKTLSVLVVASLVIVLLYDITSHIRNSNLERTEIPKVLGKAFMEVTIKGGNKITIENGRKIVFSYGRFKPIVHRISQIWVLHAVYDKTPVDVPYWEGETYLPLLTSFIPRVLYPDKPLEQTGYKFGARYGFLNSNNTEDTSVNLPWLVEFYANFGIQGVLIGMSLIGVLLAFLDRVFNAQKMNDLEFVFGTTLIFTLIYPESNLSVMTGSMLPLFVVLYVYFRLGALVLSRMLSR